MKSMHVAGTHLVPPADMLCAMHPSDRLSHVIEMVNRIDGDAEYMVLTGDLSYHGCVNLSFDEEHPRGP